MQIYQFHVISYVYIHAACNCTKNRKYKRCSKITSHMGVGQNRPEDITMLKRSLNAIILECTSLHTRKSGYILVLTPPSSPQFRISKMSHESPHKSTAH